MVIGNQNADLHARSHRFQKAAISLPNSARPFFLTIDSCGNVQVDVASWYPQDCVGCWPHFRRLTHLVGSRPDVCCGAEKGEKVLWPERQRISTFYMKPDLILIAEDDEDHVFLLKRALQKGAVLNPVFVVSDGQEAIEYLKGEGKYADRYEYPLPSLLLLDLKMPQKDGFEVLEWIRQQPGLRRL